MPTIDDFVVLRVIDGQIDGPNITWNLTPNYYSNQRSPVCFMSLDRCNLIYRGFAGQDDSSVCSTIIRTNISGQNQQNTDNGGTILDIVYTETKAVLTNYATTASGTTTTTNILTEVRNFAIKHSNPNPMKLLVPARPSTIRISVQSSNFTTFVSVNDPEIDLTESYIILRFEYDDVKDTQREYTRNFNSTL